MSLHPHNYGLWDRISRSGATEMYCSKMIAHALITVFSIIGFPEELLSDCGANLIGKLMADVYD